MLRKNNLFLTASYLTIVTIIFVIVMTLKDDLLMTKKSEKESIISIKNANGNTLQENTNKTSLQENTNNTEESVFVPVSVHIQDVPFTPQAPFANWNDIIYEEGCEEASMLMAIHWARGEPLTNEFANEEIRKISDFEKEMLGVFHDTSVIDTARIMETYFSFEKYDIRKDITKNDIIKSLQNDKILLVPVYGRDLHNKNFTPPGPIPHMIVIIGYDAAKKGFITNDPGTKYGKGFRYHEDTLFHAIWTYPTSETKPAPLTGSEVREKTMIEVSREKLR